VVGGWRGVRPVDVVLTGVLVVLGSWLMVEDVLADDPTTRVDSRSWVMVPVFLLAVVPVLWWRRSLLAVIVLSAAVMIAHDLLFGHLVRCGAGLPLAFVVAFLAGLRYRWRRGLVGLALAGVLAAAVLAWDTAAGPELLPPVLLILAVLWGIGQVAGSRSVLADELRRRNEELRALRDERAALEVAGERLQLSRQLEAVLDERLRRLESAADAGASVDDPGRARELLVAVEADSRRALEEMREVVGVLRGGEVSLAPTPSVAQLEALLARLGRRGWLCEATPGCSRRAWSCPRTGSSSTS
jgi:signal transduction histidine kinase